MSRCKRQSELVSVKQVQVADGIAELLTCSCGRRFTWAEVAQGQAVCPKCGNVSTWSHGCSDLFRDRLS